MLKNVAIIENAALVFYADEVYTILEHYCVSLEIRSNQMLKNSYLDNPQPVE